MSALHDAEIAVSEYHINAQRISQRRTELLLRSANKPEVSGGWVAGQPTQNRAIAICCDDELLQLKRSVNAVTNALYTLQNDARQRHTLQAIQLHYWQDYTLIEAANAIGWSEYKTRKALGRFLQQVKENLE